jgi:hypothetical protein
MPPPQDELELLIKEARARQRKRRLIAAVTVVFVAGAALGMYAGLHSRATANAGGVGGPAAGGSLPRCDSAQLRLTVPPWGAAAGSLYEPATLTNTSGSSCAVAGWPAVRRFNAAGQRIPVRIERWVYRLRGAAAYSVVNLAPGRAATFEIFGSDWNHRRDRACRTTQRIQVMPRGGGGWLSATASPPDVGHGIPACRYWLLGPLVPGRVANPPAYALSIFYSPPTAGHRFYSGSSVRTRWQLHVRDSGDGRYCFRVVVDGVAQGGRCGRLYGPGVSGKLGWISRSSARSFVAGAVVSRAQGITVHLSNRSSRFLLTMPPNRFLAPGISFFFTTIPAGTHPVEIEGHSRMGKGVLIWKRAR